MAVKQDMVADGTGTISMTGLESLVDKYMLEHSYLEAKQHELDDVKEQLRSVALPAIRKAGAVRAFLRGSKRVAALLTLPDYTKPANRPVINDKKMTELMKQGGLEALGLPPEEVFDEERQEGGEVIELRGRWVEWFKEHYGERLQSGSDPDMKWEKREPTIIRRVKQAVLPKLEVAAANGVAVAQLLIANGFKSISIRSEES